ncbi:MAG: DUF5655 domain-containing protein [Reichenbachiella sp.]|uniref:DUF5655 domain-containing protein n=1 Tax=Reichenbachiella sp. TaxID=2184521 RepID=UPI003296E16F
MIVYLKTLGNDVTITPKKGSISLVRKHQFVLIKPATKIRIDLGFKLKDKPITDRFGTMCTHRVMIAEVSEVDNELKSWMQEAFEQSV